MNFEFHSASKQVLYGWKPTVLGEKKGNEKEGCEWGKQDRPTRL